MSNRADPERIYQARRAANVNRLIQEEHLLPERAASLVAAWEAEGKRLGLDRLSDDFWTAGREWIEEQRQRR